MRRVRDWAWGEFNWSRGTRTDISTEILNTDFGTQDRISGVGWDQWAWWIGLDWIGCLVLG